MQLLTSQRILNDGVCSSPKYKFYVTDIHWPEFGAKDFNEAMASYRQRGRRFGGTLNVKV